MRAPTGAGPEGGEAAFRAAFHALGGRRAPDAVARGVTEAHGNRHPA